MNEEAAPGQWTWEEVLSLITWCGAGSHGGFWSDHTGMLGHWHSFHATANPVKNALRHFRVSFSTQYRLSPDQVKRSLGHTHRSLKQFLVLSWLSVWSLPHSCHWVFPDYKIRALGDARAGQNQLWRFLRIFPWMLNWTTRALSPPQDFKFPEEQDCVTYLCHSTATQPGWCSRNTWVFWRRYFCSVGKAHNMWTNFLLSERPTFYPWTLRSGTKKGTGLVIMASGWTSEGERVRGF